MNAAGPPPVVAKLGHTFTDSGLLTLALTHRSHGMPNNERLEFLGDSLVNFVIAEALYVRFPDAREGQLSRLRASLVKGATLAEIARELELGSALTLGQGESMSGGQRRDSILADALEAVIGAIYLDAGVGPCHRCILRWFDSRLVALTLDDVHKDAKTLLQEWLQARRQALPTYYTESIEGEAHAQRFKVVCRVTGLSRPCVGEGSSRRIAEQCAAANTLNALQGQS
jgi:ribonuclease-3